MANGDPLYHLSEGIRFLREDIRDLRGEMNSLRGDLEETRETVASMQGASQTAQKVEVTVDARRHRARAFIVEVAAAIGVILGAVAAVHGPFH